MRENVKLRESKFFLEHLRKSRAADEEVYQFYLSAFINAGRSVLQYAMDENQKGPRKNRVWKKPAPRKWFDGWAKDKVIKFFKEHRDQNIHFEPVEAKHQSAVMMSSGILKTKPGSKTLEVEHFTPPGPIGPKTKMRISFAAWKGTDDVEALCKKYVDLLDAFIKDGVKKGFLTQP